MTVQENARTDYRLLATEFSKPQVMAEHCDGPPPSTGTRLLVILLRDRGPDRQPYTKNLKVVSGYQRASDSFRDTASAQAPRCSTKSQNPVERLAALAEVAEQWIRQAGSVSVDYHQPLRIVHRQAA